MARWKGFRNKQNKCFYCFRTIEELKEQGIYMTVDHVIPKCRGGTNDLDNLVAACERCNNMKGESQNWYAGCVASEAFGNPEWYRDILLAEEEASKTERKGKDRGNRECESYIAGKGCFCVAKCQRQWRYEE